MSSFSVRFPSEGMQNTSKSTVQTLYDEFQMALPPRVGGSISHHMQPGVAPMTRHIVKPVAY
jgi:hypothetical protein